MTLEDAIAAHPDDGTVYLNWIGWADAQRWLYLRTGTKSRGHRALVFCHLQRSAFSNRSAKPSNANGR